MVGRLIFGIFGLCLGIYLFVIQYNKSKKLDTSNTATVKEIRKLGFSDGSRAYAIIYTINSDVPFEIIKTPCRRKPKSKTKTIFYEEGNAQNNNCFKIFKRLDPRLVIPSLFIFFSVVVLIYAFLKLVVFTV